MVTCAGIQVYWDENDKHHVHDVNVTTTSYSCSNGHTFIAKSRKGCWCGSVKAIDEVGVVKDGVIK